MTAMQISGLRRRGQIQYTHSRISLYSMLSSRFCRLGFALRIALMYALRSWMSRFCSKQNTEHKELFSAQQGQGHNFNLPQSGVKNTRVSIMMSLSRVCVCVRESVREITEPPEICSCGLMILNKSSISF